MRTVAQRLALLGTIKSLERSAAIRLLENAVRDRSPSVRFKAIEAISEQGMRDAVPLVESLLGDRSEKVRYDAAESIGRLLQGSGASHEGLRSLLLDRSPLVRIQAMESLAIVSDRGSLRAIASLLADADPHVRAYAARSIAELGGLPYVQEIEAALGTEADERARAGILEALLLLGKREVFATFLALLSSNDYHVRCAVANALDDLPLDETQLHRALASLSEAHERSLGVADRSTIKRVLGRLKSGATDSGQRG